MRTATTLRGKGTSIAAQAVSIESAVTKMRAPEWEPKVKGRELTKAARATISPACQAWAETWLRACAAPSSRAAQVAAPRIAR